MQEKWQEIIRTSEKNSLICQNFRQKKIYFQKVFLRLLIDDEFNVYKILFF